jgi:hypothetical protein
MSQRKLRRKKHGPEYQIQKDLINFLKNRGWWVERTHGNLYQQGFPDLYVGHLKFGQRWIDVKNPVAWEFTKAQCQKWPIWHQFGIGIWILTAASKEEYDKLFALPNWHDYWKPRYDEYLISADTLMEELNRDKTSCSAQSECRVSNPDNILSRRGSLNIDFNDGSDLSWLDEM